MDDLKAIARRHPPASWPVPAALSTARTPLHVVNWAYQLRDNPDREFIAYLLQGLREGFRIGFDYSRVTLLRPAKANMVSAGEHPTVVTQYLLDECANGRVIGPLGREAAEQVRQISRFGVIPKGHTPGKWRLIVDLSAPADHSVNDGIDADLCTLEYTSVDRAAALAKMLGHRCILAKIDIKNAYRIVPVHPEDTLLLGMRWQGEIYVDTALPFGLRSAPKIFNALADALSWVLQNSGVRFVLHYLDDFLLLGPPDTAECRQALAVSLQSCDELAIPIAAEKVEGPTTCLSFLGIEMDTVKWQLRLPQEKLHRTQALVASWRKRKGCTKRELLSLIGLLQHACRVVRSGRSFLRRMITLSTVAREPHHHIRLNGGFRSDLEWWATFLPHWNGVGLLGHNTHSLPGLVITSDASGNWGCGAFTDAGAWFQLPWSKAWEDVHITIKELVPVVIGCAVWGRAMSGRTVKCRTDNAAVVSIVNTGKSKDELAMHLVHCLCFFTAHFQLVVVAEHIPGVENGAADSLSRDRLSHFRLQVQSAASKATVIPSELTDMLVVSRPDWTSRSWSDQFKATLQKV